MTPTVTVHLVYFIFAIIRGNRNKTTNCIIKFNKRTWSHLQLETITHWSRERHGRAFPHGSLPSKSWMLSGTAAALCATSDEKYQSFVSPSVLLLSCLQFQFSLPLFLFFFFFLTPIPEWHKAITLTDGWGPCDVMNSKPEKTYRGGFERDHIWQLHGLLSQTFNEWLKCGSCLTVKNADMSGAH